MPNLFIALWIKIAVVALVIVVFILITVLNLKTKKPDDARDPEECDTCASKLSCPVIKREEKEKTDEQNHR